jgi:hypothetical protein
VERILHESSARLELRWADAIGGQRVDELRRLLGELASVEAAREVVTP